MQLQQLAEPRAQYAGSVDVLYVDVPASWEANTVQG